MKNGKQYLSLLIDDVHERNEGSIQLQQNDYIELLLHENYMNTICFTCK